MSHANAVLTPKAPLGLGRLIVETGWSVSAADEMLRRFLIQIDFAEMFTKWARGETFRQIRDQAESASLEAAGS